MIYQTGPAIQKEEEGDGVFTTAKKEVNGDPTPAGKIEQPDMDEYHGNLDELQAG